MFNNAIIPYLKSVVDGYVGPGQDVRIHNTQAGAHIVLGEKFKSNFNLPVFILNLKAKMIEDAALGSIPGDLMGCQGDIHVSMAVEISTKIVCAGSADDSPEPEIETVPESELESPVSAPEPESVPEPEPLDE